MAAKAKAEPSTGDEIGFNDAVTQLTSRCGSAEVAEQRLVRGLKAGTVPSSYMREDGTRVAGDVAFWKDPWLTINRAENRASIIAPLEAPIDDVPARVFAYRARPRWRWCPRRRCLGRR